MQAGNDRDPNGAAAAGGVDPLGVHVEPFEKGEEDSRDDAGEVSCPFIDLARTDGWDECGKHS